MSVTAKIAISFLMMVAVARAGDRLYTFDSDKFIDITADAGTWQRGLEQLQMQQLKQAGKFLESRKDAAWLKEKIESEKFWTKSREKSFNQVDTDKDGFLKDGDEVIEGLTQHLTTKNNGNDLFDAKAWLEPCKAEPACAEALKQRVDMDGDGKVSKKEYHDYIFDSLEDEVAMVQKRANRKVLRALQSADANKDGIVSREESVQWFADMDFALEKVKTPPTYESFDENKDGVVSKQEFSRQLLKLVRVGQTWGPTKDEALEAGQSALDAAASMLEETGRARTGFWNAYALKRMAAKEEEAKKEQAPKESNLRGGKVN